MEGKRTLKGPLWRKYHRGFKSSLVSLIFLVTSSLQGTVVSAFAYSETPKSILQVSIIGNPTAGSLLTVAGVESDQDKYSYKRSYQYEWLIDGKGFGDNGESWHLVGESEIGHFISVRVTVKRDGFDPTSVESLPLKVSGFKLAAGASHTCTVIVPLHDLRCWGSGEMGQLDIPEAVSGINGGTSSYSAGDRNTCAALNNLLTCWGMTHGHDLKNFPLTGISAVDAGKSNTCMKYTFSSYSGDIHTGLYCISTHGHVQETTFQNSNLAGFGESGSLSCALWYGSAYKEFAGRSSWSCLGPTDLVEGIQTGLMVVSGDSHACRIEDNLSVYCWGNNDQNQTEVPSNLADVRSISAGGNHTCAVTTDYKVVCWGSDSFGESDVPNDLGKVTQVAAGGKHTCALKEDSEIECWGDKTSAKVSNLNLILLPKSKPIQISQINDQQISVAVEPHLLKSDGHLYWKVYLQGAKETLCEFALPEQGCTFTGLIGKDYSFTVITGNEAGEISDTLDTKFRFCPIDLPKIDISYNTSPIVSGTRTNLKGQITNLCQAMTHAASFRTKPYGQNWSKWQSVPVSPAGKFSTSLKPDVNTLVEVRAKLADGFLYSDSIQLGVLSRYALPLSFSWTPNKVNGFNQGGDIKVTFSGDRSYNGDCTIVAYNSSAYNFALTYVGQERTFNFFKVKNGRGSGKVRMRWNGKVVVSSTCQDPHYVDVFDFRTPRFKANF